MIKCCDCKTQKCFNCEKVKEREKQLSRYGDQYETSHIKIRIDHFCSYCGEVMPDIGSYCDYSWEPAFACDCEMAANERKYKEKVDELFRRYPHKENREIINKLKFHSEINNLMSKYDITQF